MTRLEKLRTMAVEEIAPHLCKFGGLEEDFCKSDCDSGECLHEVECCVKWLNEETE